MPPEIFFMETQPQPVHFFPEPGLPGKKRREEIRFLRGDHQTDNGRRLSVCHASSPAAAPIAAAPPVQ